MKKFKKNTRSENGIALFMVMSALGVLAVLIAELTYTTQMGSRLAYNSIDNLRAFYVAKSAYKLSLVRLNAYVAIKKFLNDPNNKQIKTALPPGTLNQVWEMPMIFPLPIPPGATLIETDAINDFQKKSSLGGSFTAKITGESTRLNLNNLILASQEVQKSTPSQNNPSASPTPQPSTPPEKEVAELNFREVLEPAIQHELDYKKLKNNEFADTYRNVTGKDIVDAIAAYIGIEGSGQSNLPGFRNLTPKKAPIYNLSELHFIPGLDDRLFDLIEPLVTVNASPGINVNKLSKNGLMALIPELAELDAESIITKRDDPELGKKWNEEKEFWDSITAESSTHSAIQTIQDRFKKAGLKILTSEETFKITILSSVGQATKKVEAIVLLDSNAANKKKSTNTQNGANAPDNNANNTGQNNPNTASPNQDKTSEKASSALNLIYWKSI